MQAVRHVTIAIFLLSFANTIAGDTIIDQSNSVDGYYVFKSEITMTFDDAKKFCGDQYAELFEPRTKALNDPVIKFFSDRKQDFSEGVWIGGARRMFPFNAGNFYWLTDGTRVGASSGFQDWAGGPDNTGGNAECMQLSPTSYFHWKDADCSNKKFAACQQRVVSKPIELGSLYGTSVTLSKEIYNFNEAVAYCKSANSSLLRPYKNYWNKDLNNFVKTQLKAKDLKAKQVNFWIGASRQNQPYYVTHFFWVNDESVVDYSDEADWQGGQPDNYQGLEKCLEMRWDFDLHWNDVECGIKQYALCGKTVSAKPPKDIGTIYDVQIKVSQEVYTFDEAIKYCEDRNGVLVEPRTAAMNNLIKNYFISNGYTETGGAWMGGTRRRFIHNAVNYYWLTDKTRVAASAGFHNWRGPDNWQDREECMHFRPDSGFMWDDWHCMDRKYAVCQFKIGTSDPIVIGTLDSLNILMSKEIYNYDQAIDYCSSLGRSLFEPRTKELNNLAQNYLRLNGFRDQNINVWTGGSRINSPHPIVLFFWRFDQSWVGSGFTDWNGGQPDNYEGHEECLELRADMDYRLNDAECGIKQYVMCGVELPATIPPPTPLLALTNPPEALTNPPEAITSPTEAEASAA